MAEMYAVSKEQLTDIADAIRLKRDITTPLKVEDMPLEIGLIESGGRKLVHESSFELNDDFTKVAQTDVYVGRDASMFQEILENPNSLFVISFVVSGGDVIFEENSETFCIRYRDGLLRGGSHLMFFFGWNLHITRMDRNLGWNIRC